MLQSQLFTKTRKNGPKDEVSKNAQLLIRAGFVHKEMAGVYTFLPLGLRVLNNICRIIREEMNAIGGQELQMTTLQEKTLWEKTNRFSDEVVDVWFKTKLKNDTELGLGFTHEEPITNIMKSFIRSYRDLPVYAYQIQTKFRNETRAKSGVMRGREFLMKDLYSFCVDEAQHAAFYEQTKQAYMNVFKRVGLGDLTYLTFASGGVFSKYSHEFQTLCDAGEDLIYICENCKVAINQEIIEDQKVCTQCGKSDFKEAKAVEVGNIFSLGTRFSKDLELNYLTKEGDPQPVIMGSYGIGPSRVLGTVVEALSDDKGIVWPKSIAPFAVHLLCFNAEDKEVKAHADKVYADLQAQGIEVLYDDRELRAGEKFTDADLMGIPLQLIVSKKTMEKKKWELKDRKTGEVTEVNDLGKIFV